jgi:hypothetical protein
MKTSPGYSIIYSAERAYEAEIVRSLLRSEGINLFHVADYSAGLFGVLANLNVAVADEDAERAKEILRAFAIPESSPQKAYMSADILRTLHHFLPQENHWIKLFAIMYLGITLIFLLLQIWGWILTKFV